MFSGAAVIAGSESGPNEADKDERNFNAEKFNEECHQAKGKQTHSGF
jgi:hypothetical protein